MSLGHDASKGFLKVHDHSMDREGRGYESRVHCWYRGKTEDGMLLDEIARKHHLKRIMCHMYRLKLPSS